MFQYSSEGSVQENRAKQKNPMILILQIKHLSTVLISVVIFFETNRISGASMGACNDLIYLTARPYADGDLTLTYP